ncbi:hypothetical protein Ciccas_012854 [Cichlidogyrus casuarinus]|uniref:Hexosyltransferase n=1 Tax=Cichlidogyrus casuarinus TaxID=1844966 RepID=A0ABD2PM57_9PLAT
MWREGKALVKQLRRRPKLCLSLCLVALLMLVFYLLWDPYTFSLFYQTPYYNMSESERRLLQHWAFLNRAPDIQGSISYFVPGHGFQQSCDLLHERDWLPYLSEADSSKKRRNDALFRSLEGQLFTKDGHLDPAFQERLRLVLKSEGFHVGLGGSSTASASNGDSPTRSECFSREMLAVLVPYRFVKINIFFFVLLPPTKTSVSSKMLPAFQGAVFIADSDH